MITYTHICIASHSQRHTCTPRHGSAAGVQSAAARDREAVRGWYGVDPQQRGVCPQCRPGAGHGGLRYVWLDCFVGAMCYVLLELCVVCLCVDCCVGVMCGLTALLESCVVCFVGVMCGLLCWSHVWFALCACGGCSSFSMNHIFAYARGNLL